MVATSDDELYFLAANMRQDLVADRETMTHTTLQKVFSVMNCKSRMERTCGELSASSYADYYLVMAVHKKINHVSCAKSVVDP